METELARKKCVPCEGGVKPLAEEEARTLLPQLQADWNLEQGKLIRTFRFKDFQQSISFVNAVANIAEKEGHHPNIYVMYNRVKLELYTHAIKGLHENDFILAAKIDQLMR